MHLASRQATSRRTGGGLERWSAIALVALLPAVPAAGAEALIAVAANFAEVSERLEGDFERATGHRLEMTIGSTAKLYAQIRNGAPFDVLLAGDTERPERLEHEDRTVPGSRFTYAIGQLTLWSADADRIAGDGAETLRRAQFRRLAIANPELAPYGIAARETLAALGLQAALRDRVVMGQDIGQTVAMIATGNAELGFVALSSVLSSRLPTSGSRWDVPQELYTPIRQDAVLLRRAERNPAARDFLAFLQRPEVRESIRAYGYRLE